MLWCGGYESKYRVDELEMASFLYSGNYGNIVNTARAANSLDAVTRE